MPRQGFLQTGLAVLWGEQYYKEVNLEHGSEGLIKVTFTVLSLVQLGKPNLSQIICHCASALVTHQLSHWLN